MSKSLSLESLRKTEDPKWIREIVTPEGVPIKFTLARGGERAAAFAIDLFLQMIVILLISWGLSMAVDAERGTYLTAAIVLLTFILMNFYFALFEVRWQGQTPGKRKVGIRVIDARGGQLETSAVLARNLIRELELWTPIRFLIARTQLWPDAPNWVTFVAVGWAIVFLFFPMFNKDRLRVGDLIAGTRVVLQPKLVMAPDLVTEKTPTFGFAAPATPKAAHTFSDEQLGYYGIYELQVLEGVLRVEASSYEQLTALTAVAQKVRTKIRYTDLVTDDERFLRDFYAAQRAHLEQKMLLGQRREDKYGAKNVSKK